MSLRFQVGVCGRYKPSREHAVEAGRTFGLLGKDAEDEVREKREAARLARQAALLEWGDDIPEDADLSLGDYDHYPEPELEDEDELDDETRFDRFSLSSSLEALLESQLVKLIGLRRKYNVGWAGAEVMHAFIEREQRGAGDVWTAYRSQIMASDKEEAAFARGGTLPHDPLRSLGPSDEINLPYTAFCYLIRRLTVREELTYLLPLTCFEQICTRYCLVCHEKLKTDFEALKPYVCDKQLCTYQFYLHNRSMSIEVTEYSLASPL
jgi:ubiquitin-conjugating enzyme E2 Q